MIQPLTESPPSRTRLNRHAEVVRWAALQAVVAFSGMVMAGCGGQGGEIRTYDVPKPDVLIARHGQPPPPLAAPATATSAATVPARTLGAIIPRGQRAWFIKLIGPVEAVAAEADAFSAMVRSVTFSDQDNAPPTWTTPEGWREDARPSTATSVAYKTLLAGEHEDGPLEVTITPLPVQADEATMILDNVNRWRRQLGLAEIAGEQVAQTTERIPYDGGEAILVDLIGKRQPASGQPPFAAMAGGPSAAPVGPAAGPAPTGQLHYDVPPGWTAGAGSTLSLAAFDVASDGQRAKVTITPLTGDGGDVLDNLNRWRGQVGLGPIQRDALVSQSDVIEADGRRGLYFRVLGGDLTAPDSAILVAVLPVGGQSYFIKLIGQGALAVREEPRFKQFVESLRF